MNNPMNFCIQMFNPEGSIKLTDLERGVINLSYPVYKHSKHEVVPKKILQCIFWQ